MAIADWRWRERRVRLSDRQASGVRTLPRGRVGVPAWLVGTSTTERPVTRVGVPPARDRSSLRCENRLQIYALRIYNDMPPALHDSVSHSGTHPMHAV